MRVHISIFVFILLATFTLSGCTSSLLVDSDVDQDNELLDYAATKSKIEWKGIAHDPYLQQLMGIGSLSVTLSTKTTKISKRTKAKEIKLYPYQGWITHPGNQVFGPFPNGFELSLGTDDNQFGILTERTFVFTKVDSTTIQVNASVTAIGYRDPMDNVLLSETIDANASIPCLDTCYFSFTLKRSN